MATLLNHYLYFTSSSGNTVSSNFSLSLALSFNIVYVWSRLPYFLISYLLCWYKCYKTAFMWHLQIFSPHETDWLKLALLFPICGHRQMLISTSKKYSLGGAYMHYRSLAGELHRWAFQPGVTKRLLLGPPMPLMESIAWQPVFFPTTDGGWLSRDSPPGFYITGCAAQMGYTWGYLKPWKWPLGEPPWPWFSDPQLLNHPMAFKAHRGRSHGRKNSPCPGFQSYSL